MDLNTLRPSSIEFDFDKKYDATGKPVRSTVTLTFDAWDDSQKDVIDPVLALLNVTVRKPGCPA